MRLDWIGWIATAAFASSYFFKQPAALRWVQAGAATLWIVYGLAIHSLPVVVANLVVAGVAVVSSFSSATSGPNGAGG
jgi:class 3 adenylate cyclase